MSGLAAAVTLIPGQLSMWSGDYLHEVALEWTRSR